MRMQQAKRVHGRASALNCSLARPQGALLQYAVPARVWRGTCLGCHIEAPFGAGSFDQRVRDI